MDPILKYLLDFNKTFDIEYTERYVIPAGGLQVMLDNFDRFKLNRMEVTKDEILPNDKWQKSELEDSTLEELLELID